MRDHHNRPAGVVERIEQVHDLEARGRVEVSGGFVGQDHMGVVDKGSGNGHALLLAARELVGAVAEPPAQAHELGQSQAELRTVGIGRSLIGQRHRDVFHHAELLNQVVRLKHEAEVAAADTRERFIVERGDIVAAQEILPGGRPVEAPEQVEQCALARARGAHDRHEVALVEVDGDAGECLHILPAEPIDLGHIPHAGHHVAAGLRAILCGNTTHGGGPRSGPCWPPAWRGRCRR